MPSDSFEIWAWVVSREAPAIERSLSVEAPIVVIGRTIFWMRTICPASSSTRVGIGSTYHVPPRSGRASRAQRSKLEAEQASRRRGALRWFLEEEAIVVRELEVPQDRARDPGTGEDDEPRVLDRQPCRFTLRRD